MAIKFGRPVKQQNTPLRVTPKAHFHKETLLKILCKWHSADKFTSKYTLAVCQGEGEYRASLLSKVAIRDGRTSVLPGIVSFINQLRVDTEVELRRMGPEGLQEFKDFGFASWLHVQRMDNCFYDSLGRKLLSLIDEQKRKEWQSAQSQRTLTGQNNNPGDVGADNNRMEVDDTQEEDAEPKSRGIGKAVMKRKTVVLGGGMVGAPGSIAFRKRKRSEEEY